MTLGSNLKALIAVGLTAGGVALFSLPAQAGFEGDEFDDGPRVERRVTTTTVVERRVARPAFEEVDEAPAPVYAPRFHHHRRPVVARPVFYAQPVRPRPVYVGGYGGSCRVIVKKIENEWGDLVVKKTRICD